MVTIERTDDGVTVTGTTDNDGTHPYSDGVWTATLSADGGAIRVTSVATEHKVVHHTADGLSDFPAWPIDGDGTTVLTVDVTGAHLTA